MGGKLILKIAYELYGDIKEQHCSATSSINTCNKLTIAIGRCRLFQTQLEYDWDYHGFKRCEDCLENELKEG
jgi:hypothetical protein